MINPLLLTGVFIFALSCSSQPEEMTADISPVDNNIRLSEAQIQLANINIVGVRDGAIGRKLSLTGLLKVDEQSAVTISSRVPGRIEKLFFRNTGETVRKGDKLFEFYSEDLVDAQREYYNLQSSNWNFSGKYEPSLQLENKLLLMGMLPEQIKQMGKDGKLLFRVIIYSPASGKIRSVNVSEGQYVKAGEPMFELADDNLLWLEAQVYPDDIKLLRTGLPVTVKLPGEGELQVKSEISFINPSFEAGKNVTLIRAVINNHDNRLHPGMLAVLNVTTEIRHGMIIPSSAVISARGGDRVWVREESGSFSVRKVTTGIQSSDSVQILQGLEISDNIVERGAYLLDSESILKQGMGEMHETELSESTAQR